MQALKGALPRESAIYLDFDSTREHQRDNDSGRSGAAPRNRTRGSD
jgi:hypothetical protein